VRFGGTSGHARFVRTFCNFVGGRSDARCDGGIIEQGDPKRVLVDPAHARTRQFLRAVLER